MLVVVKGGGDVGSGVAHRLVKAGMHVVITEIERPTVVRRAVSFAGAVYEGEVEVEGVKAKRAENLDQALILLNEGWIPVVVDSRAETVKTMRPDVVVDALMAKKNLGTKMTDAPIVVGLGPGFTAGLDVHAVVETKRGHYLGKVIYEGKAEKDTATPGPIEGYTVERVLRAPADGLFRSIKKIGDKVAKGEQVASVEGHPIFSQIPGVIRGLLRDGLQVVKGQKVGDVDPRGIVEYCFTISDRARAIGGGVLEAILNLQRKARKQS